MPNFPQKKLEPRIDDLEDGTRLEIVKIGKDEKTQKGYDVITCTLKDGSEIRATGKALIGSLRDCRDDSNLRFGQSDPLTAIKNTKTGQKGPYPVLVPV